jgi:hypothetical protein
MSQMELDIIMGNTGLLQFNDTQRTENCVWVATAHLLGFSSVSDLEYQLDLPAPEGGSSLDQQQEFRIKLGEYNERVYGQLAVWTLLYNTLPSQSDCVVLIQRADGSGHCVNRVGGQFLDFQLNDEGDDATEDVERSTIVCSWFFELARW